MPAMTCTNSSLPALVGFMLALVAALLPAADVWAAPRDCSAACAADGLCGRGKKGCFARRNSDCQSSQGCIVDGRCNLVLDRCEALIEPDCDRSSGCMASGRCTFHRGKCIVATAADCALSNLCKLEGKCTFSAGGCVAGRSLDKRAGTPEKQGFSAALGASVATFAGTTDDPGLYLGAAARIGWALPHVTVHLAAELYGRTSFTHDVTVAATSGSGTATVQQKINTALTRINVLASYRVLGDADQGPTLYAIGGTGVLFYDLVRNPVAAKSGFDDVGTEPIGLMLLQLDVGLGFEFQAGPVRPFADVRFAIPLGGGPSEPLNFATPGIMSAMVGARIGL